LKKTHITPTASQDDAPPYFFDDFFFPKSPLQGKKIPLRQKENFLPEGENKHIPKVGASHSLGL
jgi:hypothetical protein